jgi:D-alanyl-D-alanine carboxypeptidase
MSGSLGKMSGLVRTIGLCGYRADDYVSSGARPVRPLRGRRSVLLAMVVMGCALATVAFLASSRKSEEDGLDPLLERVIAAGAPGLLLLVRDGSTIRIHVRGVAVRDPVRQVRAGDRFRIGSVTKTFVATLVLQLVNEGRIALDDTLEEWLPGLVPGGRTITVRHLLSHRSGLFDYVEDPKVFAPYNQEPAHDWDPRRLVEIAVAHPAPFAPGNRFAYSSTNYLLLGLIVEAATGGHLEQQLRQRIFKPLGLRQTTFGPRFVNGSFIHGHRAPSHQGVITGPAADTSLEAATWTWAAGAIVSSADDVRSFFARLLEGRLLTIGLLREMETLVPAGRLRYGLGMAVFPTPCGNAWGHTGNVQGTVTVAWNRKDASRQIVLVVNTYPLSGDLEAAVERVQIAAFCGTD